MTKSGNSCRLRGHHARVLAAANTGKIFFPAELFKLDAENRDFFSQKLNWVLKSKHPDAETYCKAIACALMVKDMMRVICTLVYQLRDPLGLIRLCSTPSARPT